MTDILAWTIVVLFVGGIAAVFARSVYRTLSLSGEGEDIIVAGCGTLLLVSFLFMWAVFHLFVPR